MKSSFIEECVTYLYGKYGVEISDVKIVLPSKRASLFFNMALSKLITDRPLWQPKYYSIDNLFFELSGGIVVAERLKLLTVLYGVYSKYHTETFDMFYYWGDMLLSDFEAIDNYMVNAKLLFENSADIKDIESQFEYMSEEDAEEIRRFWRHFESSRNSEEKDYFFNIWRTLYPIYNEFREQLSSEGIGYRGMICRTVAEDILSGAVGIEKSQRYAVVGFNALSNTEKVLLDALSGHDFLWDGDRFYVEDRSSEAGIFLRSNIERYGESNTSVVHDNYLQDKDITIVKSPSASIECKYVWEFLEKCAEGGKRLGAETAIVLTDESLLLPVLYSIPPFIEHFNVTAGYELRLTQAYSLLEDIMKLQTNFNGEFYYKDVEGLLRNELVRMVLSPQQWVEVEVVISRAKIYYTPEELHKSDFLEVLFSKCSGWAQIGDYLMFILNRILSKLSSARAEVKEAMFKTYNAVAELTGQVATLGIDISDAIFLSLVRKHIKHERISFEGEPLLGIQVMGILESRTLDFENVLILSVGEDNFPSKSLGASFIPSNLRHGYGLPTSNYHQAMYSYYFYRLLQRARRVDISYISMSNELSSGEPSRYIYQLQYSKKHDIDFQELSFSLTTTDVGDLTVAKNDKAIRYIEEIKTSERSLSASSLHRYIECPMRFYYADVEKVATRDEEREREFDAMESGNVMHKVLEAIYRPLVGVSHAEVVKSLSALTATEIGAMVERTLKERLGVEEIDAAIGYDMKTIVKYISTIVEYDLRREDGFTVVDIEKPINGEITLDGSKICFSGYIDRIDRLASGVHRIIDYKSGRGVVCDSLSSLFDTTAERNDKAVMQSLLYALLYGEGQRVETSPSLYHARDMNKTDYRSEVKIKGIGEITRFSEIKEEYSGELKNKISELLDLDTPFYKCNSEKKCKYCDFYHLCTI